LITSTDNPKLKQIRKLQTKRERARSGLFAVEGEDLVAAATSEPEYLLRADVDVEAKLLDSVSTLGSGTRVIGVYRQEWAQPGGDLSVYLHGVGDPGNVGTIIRSAHAFADGPVILGPGCADPYSSKAVRASMGSIFARPPARATFESIAGNTIALDQHADLALAEVEAHPPVTLCVGGERKGLPAELTATHRARIPLREDGPDSLNAAVSAAIGLYRMAADA
jgi:TrmH family RNA methyltransferase